MSDHNTTPITRRCDVAIVGGSAAGLAAALQIVRQARSVIVVDSGEPRNAPAAHMHGYLGFDGRPPADLIATGRDEVRRYGGEILAGRVVSVDRVPSGLFRIDAGGVHVLARRVVVATGVRDVLPEIEGLAEHWGAGAIHCPFCHGYEVRDRPLVQVVTHPLALHPAHLFAHLGAELTVIVRPDLDVDEDEEASLRSRAVRVVRDDVSRLTVGADGAVAGVELATGSTVAADAVIVPGTVVPRIDPFVGLGLVAEPHPSGAGHHVAVDPTGATAVDGLYAAGNVTDPSQQVLQAAAHGSRVGAMVAFDLAADDDPAGRVASANEAEWDDRYSGEQVWSGTANGTLVTEIGDDSPGRALDVGAGEGGDAVWLAERGWEVTATDIARPGLAQVEAEAMRRNVTIRTVRADANGPDPFDDTYDLVSIFYSAIPRTGDDRATRNLLTAVAPGGTLLMVGHAAPRRSGSHDGHVRPWDGEAFVGVEHVEAAIRSTPGWTVVTSEVRSRPPGSATHGHHDEDVVLRARRDR